MIGSGFLLTLWRWQHGGFWLAFQWKLLIHNSSSQKKQTVISLRRYKQNHSIWGWLLKINKISGKARARTIRLTMIQKGRYCEHSSSRVWMWRVFWDGACRIRRQGKPEQDDQSWHAADGGGRERVWRGRQVNVTEEVLESRSLAAAGDELAGLNRKEKN